MNIQQNYIRQVLHDALVQVRRRSGDIGADNVVKVLNKVSQANNMRKTLSALCRVSGFELIALRLLWLMQSVSVEGCVPSDSVTAHEVRTLVGHLIPLCERHTQKEA